MTNQKTAALILAAGKGTRMKSDIPKVLHKVAGRSLLGHVIDTASALQSERTVVVVGPGMDSVAREASPHHTVVQHDQLGTADAVKPAREALNSFSDGTIFILYGDTPFIRPQTLEAMLAQRTAGAAIVVLGFRPADPAEYGRLIVNDDGSLDAIVEFREANAAQRAVTLCNSGVLAVDAQHLFSLVDQVKNDNAKGEFYLTDIVELARKQDLKAAVVEAPEEELLGINSRRDLAAAESYWQQNKRIEMMDNGVTLIDPDTVYFAYDTEIGRDVVIAPHVFFGPGVRIAPDVDIRSYCHFEGATVNSGAIIGPFARLRPGAELSENVHIGNFVEVKNAHLGEGAKANHLAYLGDTDVGAGSNIGAGTITCNYDGYFKHRTVIGENAFIGSNSSLVAPVSIGKGAIVAAGSVITREVNDDALALGRGRQEAKQGWALTFHTEMAARKAESKKEK